MREEIMNEAITLFSKYGYKKTTIDDIANALQMSKGNIYRYFVNKEDLYHQAVSSILDEWRVFVQGEAGKVKDPLGKFRLMAEVAIHYPEKHGDFCNIVLQNPEIFAISHGKDEYRAVNGAAEDLLKSVLKQGVEDGSFSDVNIEYTTELLFSIYMMHLIKIYGNGEGERGIEIYMQCIDLIINGLKNRP